MPAQLDMDFSRPPYPASPGATLRNEGIARVTENSGSWMDEARAAALSFLPGVSGKLITADVIRDAVLRRAGPPHHFNAWGALVNGLVKRGHLLPTGRVAASPRASNHAHRNPIYEVV